jgi:hypothetical protein
MSLVSQRAPRADLASAFDVRGGRAMVSLGALSPKKYCTFSCPFCYVRADFGSYPTMDTDDILAWLRANRESFDIVYVSGDTDSFARPRTARALDLLQRLAELDVDVLFTTRHVFSERELDELASACVAVTAHGRSLIGCVSVAQLTVPHLEPRPIRPPAERLEQLERFRNLGIVNVLALRPFVPVVPEDDYIEIVRAAADYGTQVVLGEVWYADAAGVLEAGVFRGPVPAGVEVAEHTMDFDSNAAVWRVYPMDETRRLVARECSKYRLPFFMRSRPAIEFIRRARVSEQSPDPAKHTGPRLPRAK